MRATNWEFTNRAMVFGLIFGCTFPLYVVDPQNSSAALANWLGPRLSWHPDVLARALFAAAAFLMAIAANCRFSDKHTSLISSDLQSSI